MKNFVVEHEKSFITSFYFSGCGHSFPYFPDLFILSAFSLNIWASSQEKPDIVACKHEIRRGACASALCVICSLKSTIRGLSQKGAMCIFYSFGKHIFLVLY